jgi:quercetin dioxygenase-like cupin family protein
MNTKRNFVKILTIAATLFSTVAVNSALGASESTVTQSALKESTSKLLTVRFDPREVVEIETGDFHFVPGQIAPIHTHDAPVIGYVSKGQILYQVEGMKPQLLREGDAFYEPAGPRILRFDNASATEEAIFIDFNRQQKNEPFIVFEKELTEHIDRRSLPTVKLKGKLLTQADIFVSEIEPNGHKRLEADVPVLSYVAEGAVKVVNSVKGIQNYRVGESFSLIEPKDTSTVVNNSQDLPAKVISFYLL